MDCGIAHGSYLVVSALIKIKRLHFLVGGTLHHQLQDLGQDCYRVLVSIISWPGQLLSLNPCQRPKILARMFFCVEILSLTTIQGDPSECVFNFSLTKTEEL